MSANKVADNPRHSWISAEWLVRTRQIVENRPYILGLPAPTRD
jgi:hypothetical protein